MSNKMKKYLDKPAPKKIIAEVKWGAAGADYICYRDYFGARIEVDDIDLDDWCEF